MLVQPLESRSGKVTGEPVLAIDKKFGAGPGDTVLLLDEGGSARQVLEDPRAPVRLIVCGVVDSFSIGKKDFKFH